MTFRRLLLAALGLMMFAATATRSTASVSPGGAGGAIRATGAPVGIPLVKQYPQVGQPPRIWAHGAALLDGQTGEVIWEQNSRRKLHPASTTKVVTALIAAERGDLNAKVTVSRRAARTPGSSMYIKEGEVYSLHDLLHGLLLRSGNDAAVAIAEHIGGSVERFAEMMNQRARELGARDSHFVNPHGLTDDQHLSTAYDLALISRTALHNPVFARIVALPAKELTFEELDRKVILQNTNRLLSWLPGADGVKTGTTGAAGPCLVASATREEQQLIAVVLNASNRWQESARLLEWGFANWRVADLGRAGEILRFLPIGGGKKTHLAVALKEDLAMVLPRRSVEEGPMPTITLQVTKRLGAPIQKGDQVGVAHVAGPPGPEHSVALVAAESVPEATWLDQIYRFFLSSLEMLDRMGMNVLVP